MVNISYSMTKWLPIILITLLIRFGLLLFSLIVTQNQTINLFNVWIRWDGPHYIDIAQNWYQTAGDPANFIVFYPLYPILIKVTAFFVRDFNLSAILVSWIFSITASILLYELTLLDFNKRTGFLAVFFMNIFPTSYFLQAPYTEALFLTTSLASIYFFRKRLFINSAIGGILSTLTRINGITLLSLFAVETKSLKSSLITFILTPFGFLIYLWINYSVFRDPFHFSKILSAHWYKQLTWPWISIQNLINFIIRRNSDYRFLFSLELLTIFLLFISSIIVYLKVRKSYGIYMIFNLLLFSSTNFIMSTPRYALILFPIFIALAKITNRLVIIILSLVSVSLLLYLTLFYTQGQWAF